MKEYSRLLTEEASAEKCQRYLQRDAILKKSVSTRHHNRPFVQGPHVGMEIVGADSLHKCRNNVIRVKENLCSQITIFQRNQERKQV